MTVPGASDIAQSLAGRDKGKLFFVLETDGQFALIADGKLRKISKPKRKKLRHLAFVALGDPPFAARIKSGELVSDKEVRKALAIFKAGREQA